MHALAADPNDTDPIAISCYGLLRKDIHRVLIRFVDGRPSGCITIQFLDWLTGLLNFEGKKRLIVVWDDAPWHASEDVVAWIREHNARTRQGGGTEVIHFELPTGSPWLNNIEPCWTHAKRSIMEPDRKLTARETMDRVCEHFGCHLLPCLR
jgi:transposase